MNKPTLVFASPFLLAAVILGSQPGYAQGSNDFFGSSVPGGSNGQSPGAAAAEQQLNNGNPTDYTQDEKRMQKKYKANLQAAQDLIAKGEKMMKDAQKGHHDKEMKKGKILKEIGEKRVAELKANCPMPELGK